MVQCAFDEACLADKYQRNNKDSGQKNLRCFPQCDPRGHIKYGFCGQAVEMKITGAHNPAALHAWAEFCLAESKPTINAGDVWDLSEIQGKLERTRKKPSKDWIKGHVCDGNHIKFNKDRLGWHYSWVSNVHTCDSLHVLRAYVFEEIAGSPGSLRCLTAHDSSPFRIYCSRRRQRNNAAAKAAAAAAAAAAASAAQSNSHAVRQVPHPIKTEMLCSAGPHSLSTHFDFDIATPTCNKLQNALSQGANLSPKKRKFHDLEAALEQRQVFPHVHANSHPALMKKHKSEPACFTPPAAPSSDAAAAKLHHLKHLLGLGHTSPAVIASLLTGLNNGSSGSATASPARSPVSNPEGVAGGDLQSLFQMALAASAGHSPMPRFGTASAGMGLPQHQLQSLFPFGSNASSASELAMLVNHQVLLNKLAGIPGAAASSPFFASTPTHSPAQSPNGSPLGSPLPSRGPSPFGIHAKHSDCGNDENSDGSNVSASRLLGLNY